MANAVYDGTSCVMLSGETASGKYPLEALATMDKIVTTAEGSIDFWERMHQFLEGPETIEPNINDAITHTCCLTAKDLNAAAITTTTLSGHTARMISRFHPACPIAALTTREKVRRQMNLYWGVQPYLTGEITSTDRIFSLCAEVAVKEGIAKNGDTIVVTAGVPLGQAVETNLIKAHVIDDEEARC